MTRVLLADNDELVRAVLGKALGEAGYEVSLAADGLQALCRIEERRPDVLVLDLVMPRLDGARLCRHLKANPRFTSLPVLILTGAAPEATPGLAELRADGWLAKRDAGGMIRDLLRWLGALQEGGARPAPPEQTGQPRQIVRELLAEAAHLTTVLQGLGEAVLLLDPEGRVVFENQAGGEILGRGEAELLNHPVEVILEPPAARSLRGALQELTRKTEPQTTRLEITHGDRVLYATVTSLVEHARPTGYILLMQDMTALSRRLQERTAQLERALKAKAEFLAKVSHELRTPLNFIVGFADLLQRGETGPLTQKQARYLDRVQAGARRLLELVTNLLELSLADAGGSRLKLERVAMHAVVREVFDIFDLQARRRRLGLRADVEPALHVVADGRKLVQVLGNLVGNAVKFTSDGGQITVAARKAVGGAGEAHVDISVTDTGVGIAAEDLERIFFGFQQADDPTGDRAGGVGIGLALARALVELHGGQIWAESAGRGHGARLVVRLPCLATPGPRRILIVEDEPELLEALCALLAGAGYAPERAATGEAALAAIDTTVPDLVLLDLGLPDVNGLTVLRWLRGRPGSEAVPVLVLTGRSRDEAQASVPEGATDFLTKPFSPTVLLRTIGGLLAVSPGER
jgi:PAS domain S-box-containing protein